MATTYQQAFNEFARRIALTSKQRQAIKQRRDRIRSYLANDGWWIHNAFFGGSHARRTKVRPVGDGKSDVDIYYVLDRAYLSRYGQLLSPPPSQLLSDIKTSLDKYLKTPAVRADSPSVRIRYDDMDVDVVPCFGRIFVRGLRIPYYKSWTLATPLEQRKLFSDFNQATGGRAIPVMRMIKHWKLVHPSFPLRSYHLEVIAYNVLRQTGIDNYRDGVADFFLNAANFVAYNYVDPGGSGNSVSAYMTPKMRDSAISMFRSAAERARAGLNTKTHAQEIEVWRSSRLFGTRFPAYG